MPKMRRAQEQQTSEARGTPCLDGRASNHKRWEKQSAEVRGCREGVYIQ
jgi:hypothetical protein